MPIKVDHSLRRKEVAQIAAHLIAKRGIHYTTIREVAKQSGHSRNIVEHYFKNKEDLINSALALANEQYFSRMESVLIGRKGLDSLRARLKSVLPMNEETRDEWSIRMQFWCFVALNYSADTEQSHRTSLHVQGYVNDLIEARDMGEVKRHIAIKSQAHQLANLVTGLSINAMHSPDFYTNRKLVRTVNAAVQAISAT